MSESLPLIPDKNGAVCGDVRGVLRAVFKDLDYLPPLAPRAHQQPGSSQPAAATWIEKYESDRRAIGEREDELRQQYARRLARDPLPNIYRLQPAAPQAQQAPGQAAAGPVQRADLRPTVVQACDAEDALWVRNILARSSGDLTPLQLRGVRVAPPLRAPSDTSFMSMSIGAAPAPLPAPVPPRPAPPPPPEHVVCVPPALDFVNFTVGQLHTQAVRVVNVCRREVRLSVRPPAGAELELELCAPRGLALSSGAAATIRVHFRPRAVRVVRDEVSVRVSSGQHLRVPITCYMEPPLLDILVPAVSPSGLWCAGSEAAVARSADCVELGARLLGATHCVPVVLHCAATHAAFFLLTEDAWLSFTLDVVTARGSVVAAPFVVWPAWWGGGGAVRACVWCRPTCAGVHAAALRIVCSTAVVRPLHLIADALYFRPEHITLQAQDKDYDICSDDDPACEYYVHLGTAFPRRPLAATVTLLNHSPIVYQYYWSVRPWGECCCWEEEPREGHADDSRQTERKDSKGRKTDGDGKNSSSSEGVCDESDSSGLCVGAKEARDKERLGVSVGGGGAALVRVEPARGAVEARAAVTVHVCTPDAGAALGTQRAVLMLILKGIPKESLPADYEPMILKTELVDSDPVPGVKRCKREVCEVVCTQLEVWWEVAPLRFAIDPPTVHLAYSRRVAGVELVLRATQLCGAAGISCSWRVPPHVARPELAHLRLAAAHSLAARMLYNLPPLPNAFPETHDITLESECGEWSASSSVSSWCSTRAPALRPARRWLAVVPPGQPVRATLQLINDTYQHICWWATPHRWHGENYPRAACAEGGVCAACRERACTCDMIRPARGALHHGEEAHIQYSVHAPQSDGCVVTLVQARRTGADVARVAAGAGSDGRATLLAYRVLAPTLTLRLLPCGGDHTTDCAGCAVEAGGGARGSAVLRPGAALTVGGRTCYRLQLTNITPIDTTLHWDPPIEEEYLKVIFVPTEINVRGYQQVTVQVVLEARRVCSRRVSVRRARVLHAHRPLYLLIDAAIAGLEVVIEVPLGGGESTDCTAIMRRSQAEEFPWADPRLPESFEDIFSWEDEKRALRAENICRCKSRLQYVPPPPPPPRAPPLHEDDYPPIQIVWEPPPLSRVCACREHRAPLLPEHGEPLCLQFRNLPLREVRSRVVVIRNQSAVSAAWSAAVRHHPRQHTTTLEQVVGEEWAGCAGRAGLALQAAPAGGVVAARQAVALRLLVYADCWGLYRDQLAIKLERLEAVVVDVWVEAVGPPLLFALNISPRHGAPVVCWMSRSAEGRSVRVKNESRAPLVLHAYLTTQHEEARDALPFRLYMRLVDTEPAACPCCRPAHGSGSEASSEPEPATGVELLLAADGGPQSDRHYQVEPESMCLGAGEWGVWRVRGAGPRAPPAPRARLLLRALPVHHSGWWWHRPPPPLQAVCLVAAPREPELRASHRELRVRLCALDLPYMDVMRVRKRFQLRNVGNGALQVAAATGAPWTLVQDEPRPACGSGCACGPPRRSLRAPARRLHLAPRSALEMCVEVAVHTELAWPPPAPPAPPAPPYEPRRVTTTPLHFYDDDEVLMSIPLVLELEYPALAVEPAVLDLGVVTDGDCSKSYFSVSHTARSQGVQVECVWEGCAGWSVWPRALPVAAGRAARVYVQYCARWRGGAPAEGVLRVRCAGGAGRWCRAAAAARATPARGARAPPPADRTDDPHLLPPARGL